MNQYILHKYFKGTATPAEEEMILDWVEQSEENRNTFQKERMFYDVALFAGSKRPGFKERHKQRLIPLFKWSASIAASLIMMITVGQLIRYHLYEKSSHLQTITVPQAQRAQITLADGTKVWLNSQSTLTYSANFGRKNRTVELDGEAYFEVTPNASIPFHVNTEKNRIVVVGTSFNVCAYSGSNEFEATLVEGIVDIYSLNGNRVITRLTRDEFFGAYADHFKKTILPSYDFLRWKEGLYCFDDAPFNSILNKLEKYYNVKFIVENPEVLDYHCTGKFKEQDGVEHILKAIQKDHRFSYEIDHEQDIVRIR